MTRVICEGKRRRTPLLAMALFGVVVGVLIGGGSFVAAAPSTDASVVDYSQCANGKPNATPANDPTTCNGGWINGILNANDSQYSEDQVTAQRLVVELPKGGPIGDGSTTGDRTITLKYLWNKSSNHAYDSLALWDTTITGLDAAGVCTGVPGGANGCPANSGNFNGGLGDSHLQVPSSPCSDGTLANTTINHQLSDRSLVMFGGTIDAVSVPANDSSSCSTSADEFETVTIYYHVASLASNTRVMLLFGGHLAAGSTPPTSPRGWGTGLGSASINGGPYHIKLVQLDTSSIGNRDNQITSGAIIPLALSNLTSSPHGTPTTTLSWSATVNDDAIVTGVAPTGTVTFKLYGPFTSAPTATSCVDSGTGITLIWTSSALDITTGTASNSGNTWTKNSGNAVVTIGSAGTYGPGYYQWVYSYSGDGANTPGSTSCGDTSEQEHVIAATKNDATATP